MHDFWPFFVIFWCIFVVFLVNQGDTDCIIARAHVRTYCSRELFPIPGPVTYTVYGLHVGAKHGLMDWTVD